VNEGKEKTTYEGEDGKGDYEEIASLLGEEALGR
jgi:hypothetical protein